MKKKYPNPSKGLFLILIISINTLSILIFSTPIHAQSANSAAWKNAGGIKVLSGNQHFTTSWSSSSESRSIGKYWKGSFYESNPQYAPWDPTVKNSVAPVKGKFTVKGPGHIGLSQKDNGGASIVMYDAKTKERFIPFGLGANINPDGEFWGKIPPDVEITIVVEAQMSAYNNTMNTGEYSFRAPQEVDFEIWFFPQEGGSVIGLKSTKPKFNKPKPGILYYVDKECK